jgi:uncharacterized protein (UPF0210 family)
MDMPQNAPIRTITMGMATPHPLKPVDIRQAARFLRRAGARFQEAGYEVQTVRLSTRPLFDDLREWSPGALLTYVRGLQDMLDEEELAFCSLGPAQAARPDFPLERIEEIADLLAATTAINATAQLAMPGGEVRTEAALPAARVIWRLACETAEGFGNFRFAALACVEPGSPFFPAAYHGGPASVSLGVQGAGVVSRAMQAFWLQHASEDGIPDLAAIRAWLRDAITGQTAPLVELGKTLAAEEGMSFGGIDLSPAPMGEDSIIPAFEAGGNVFGDSGTLGLASAFTAALKSTGLPTCGYCGLMLPVLEDALLGRRWEEGRITTDQLLLYSAVCGTGLDTLPLPGDSDPQSIARLLLDVASLAARLHKPLSARLFPVPGKGSGERTEFTSPYLTNTLVK